MRDFSKGVYKFLDMKKMEESKKDSISCCLKEAECKKVWGPKKGRKPPKRYLKEKKKGLEYASFK